MKDKNDGNTSDFFDKIGMRFAEFIRELISLAATELEEEEKATCGSEEEEEEEEEAVMSALERSLNKYKKTLKERRILDRKLTRVLDSVIFCHSAMDGSDANLGFVRSFSKVREFDPSTS